MRHEKNKKAKKQEPKALIKVTQEADKFIAVHSKGSPEDLDTMIKTVIAWFIDKFVNEDYKAEYLLELIEQVKEATEDKQKNIEISNKDSFEKLLEQIHKLDSLKAKYGGK